MTSVRNCLGLIALAPLFLAACGSNSKVSGFAGSGEDGGGGLDGTTLDGSGGHQDSGVLNLNPDGGGGGETAPPCTGLACQVKSCGAGEDTTVTGYVYAPNGTLPLYDVQVFIPNAPLEPFSKGIQCDHCGAQVSGSPITTGLSDPTGHFTLTGVPSGTDIPIVVQLGKWRRQAVIPKVNSCTANPLTDPNLTRLPKNQMEGSMPHIALTTGECDQMGCMLPKVGIDPAEFGYQADGYNKAINTYTGDGQTLATATPAANLWSTPTLLNTYDVGIFSCECTETPEAAVGSPYYGVVTDYLNAGGRIFTTDFQYTWYKYSPDVMLGGGSLTPFMSSTGANIGIGEVAGGAPPGGTPMTLVTSFPKGAALAQWLKFVYSGTPLPSGTTYPVDMYAQMGEVSPDVMYGNVQSLDSTKTTDWGDSPYVNDGFTIGPPTGTTEPRVFTVDTPVGTPSAMQCGRGVHIDAHVDNDGTDNVDCEGTTCYPATCSTTLKPDEAMFAFFFFDLASCIQEETAPPAPPPPAPK